VAVVTAPRRIQLSRSKGWRIADACTNPNGYVIVDRRTKYGNPYKLLKAGRGDQWVVVNGDGQRPLPSLPPAPRYWALEEAVSRFKDDLRRGLLPYTATDVRRDLAGKDIACWCRVGWPCHGYPLLAIANEEAP
jgi:hypothetical protein